MLTLIIFVLIILEYKKNGELTMYDFKFASMFILIDIIDFTIAYFLFT